MESKQKISFYLKITAISKLFYQVIPNIKHFFDSINTFQ